MKPQGPRTGFSGTVPGLRRLEYGDIVYLIAGLLLSYYAAALTGGLMHSTSLRPTGPAVAVLTVATMTAPVLFARRAPRAAAATLAAGAVLNWIAYPGIVRCGPCLPAAFLVAFAVGRRTEKRPDLVLGMGLVAVNLIVQAVADPRLGASTMAFLLPLGIGFCLIGRVVASRSAAAAALRERNVELARQREATTRLAVTADRERIAGDVEGVLHQRLGEIESFATAGRAAMEAQPEQAARAFAAIQETGRDTLGHLRGVVSDLREAAPTSPQPTLAQLAQLVERIPGADVRLHVVGDPRSLAPGVELSGYRIVEHLLAALADDPEARVDVTVTVRPEALELRVAGPAQGMVEKPAALVAAEQRAALHGGTLQVATRGSRREMVVSLPVLAGRA
jgi:signal transduction histidine kinase